jgi:hypothetical protein
MLKRGQVYKARIDSNHGLPRDYMIFAPSCDIQDSEMCGTISPIFHINLAERLNYHGSMGFIGLIEITKPSTIQDFEDIREACKRYNLRYNRKLNMIIEQS